LDRNKTSAYQKRVDPLRFKIEIAQKLNLPNILEMLHQIFESIAKEHGEDIVIATNDKSNWTYNQLNNQSNQFANFLRENCKSRLCCCVFG